MAFGVVPTGFDIKPFDVIEDEMKQEIWAAISAELDLSAQALLGQLLTVTAGQTHSVWEALQAIYASMDPNQATGAALDRICAYTGITRLSAQASRALMTITLAAGTYPANSLRVSQPGDTINVFANVSDITVASPTTLTGQIFDCINLGPVVANANTLTVIASPVTGFSAPNNPAAADTGRLTENDAELRARRVQTLAVTGTSSVDAIRSEILVIPEVDYCTVLENVTDTVDGNGVAAHGVMALVVGGVDTEIAQAIFDTKAAGINTSGTTLVQVNDNSGNPHPIRFQRPTPVVINMNAAFSWITGTYPDGAAASAAVKKAITDAAPTFQQVGFDVVRARYVQAVMELGTIADCTITCAINPSAPAAANVVISATQQASIVDANITTTPTEVPTRP